MLTLLLAAPAFAHDAEENKPDRPEFHVEASSQLLPDTVALDLRVAAEGKHDGYVNVAMRVDPTGAWIGHTGVGFDLFGGGSAVDLKLGLFLGAVGDLSEQAMFGRPAVGGEVTFGLKFGRVYGHYRHLDGFAGPLEDRLTEDELRLGFCLTDHVRVHGQLVALNPGDEVWRGGAGVGAEFVF